MFNIEVSQHYLWVNNLKTDITSRRDIMSGINYVLLIQRFNETGKLEILMMCGSKCKQITRYGAQEEKIPCLNYTEGFQRHP